MPLGSWLISGQIRIQKRNASVLLTGTLQLIESIFSFYCMRSQDQTQDVTVGIKCLYLLSHLSGLFFPLYSVGHLSLWVGRRGSVHFGWSPSSPDLYGSTLPSRGPSLGEFRCACWLKTDSEGEYQGAERKQENHSEPYSEGVTQGAWRGRRSIQTLSQ